VRLEPEVLPLTEGASLERGVDGHAVSYRVAIPFFGLLWRPLVARRARRVEVAADAGDPLPTDVPWWAPPVPTDASTNAAVASLVLLSAVIGYAGGIGGLLTQTLPYAADVYHVTDATLGRGLAVVRGGVVLALLVGAVADRRGRRRFVIAAALAHCVLGAALGLAPSFDFYVAGHVLLRAIDVAVGVALAVLAVESSPAGNRAVTLSLLALGAGGGVVLAVCALPVAAAGRAGFAAVYGVGLLAVPLVIVAGRRLAESPRYLAHAEEPHRYREVLGPRYRGSLAMVGTALFLSSSFYAPGVEFFNRYLDDVRDFSALKLVLFLAVTGLPAALGIVLGGRLADLRGRKAVGVPLLVGGVACYSGFYLTPEPWLWGFALAGQILLAGGASALAPYGSELFPTRIRAAANTILLVIGVGGSALGLALAGELAEPLGIGPAVAVLGALPLLGAVIVTIWFPETARRELEDTSGDIPVTLEKPF